MDAAVADIAPAVVIPPPPSAELRAALDKIRAEKKRAATEPLSPFVPWSAEERAPLPEEALAPPEERQLLLELLRGPALVVERLLDPSRLQGLVVGSLGIITVCTSLFAATLSAAHPDGRLWVVPAALTSCNVLLSLAASLGPIYGASVLLAARVPVARLVATLLAAAATGSLLLAGLAPPMYLLWVLDSEWAGPLMVLGAFALSGWAAGARTYRLLREMAEGVTRAALGDPEAKLSKEDAFRVGILARVSLMMVAFTSALGFWAFKALG